MAKNTAVKDTPETPETPTLDRVQLIEVGETLNVKLGLSKEDFISLEDEVTDEDLFESIKKAAELIGINEHGNFDTRVLKQDRADIGEDAWDFLMDNNMLEHTKKEPEPAPESKSGPVKKEKTKAAKAPATEGGKKRGFQPSPESIERHKYIESLFEKGKYTKAEIIDLVQKKYPDSKLSTLATLITDSKNPKYNKFSKLVVADDNGILSFTD